jgi:hypothetical protein
MGNLNLLLITTTPLSFATQTGNKLKVQQIFMEHEPNTYFFHKIKILNYEKFGKNFYLACKNK